MINVLFVLMSSVKWGHLGNFELKSTNTIFLTKNPMWSSKTL